jgi:prepilin-type processing-associated H-X9-DG protein/prepilin-type N-terminal cleavage/methylation domain-containing protein
MRHRRRRGGGGFSLVELLVVIGIVGLLLALLFPALGAARARAESLQCQANLRTMGFAAMMHANEHRGHLPVAGYHWEAVLEPPGPEGLKDPVARRYTYYREDDVDRPVPFSVALALQMGVPVRLDSREHLEEDMQTEELRKHFRCPSQTLQLPGLTQTMRPWQAPFEWSSYVANEALLGTGIQKDEHPLGKLEKIRRPSVVMLAMDGKRRYPEGEPLNWLMIPPSRMFNDKQSTLADYRKASLDPAYDYLGREALDYLRHSWRANVLFVDGHVESVVLSDEGCRAVGICNGIYD